MDNLLGILSKIIAVPSVLDRAREGAPFGADNLNALEIMLAVGHEYGFKTYNGVGYYGYIDFEGTDNDAGLIGILCHLDVVPAGAGWVNPPFELTVKDGFAYGRGIVDNKGPAVCALEAMRQLKNSGFTPRHNVRLILGCNEENGSACIKRYREEQVIPKASFVPDADFPVVTSEMGILILKLEVDMGGLEVVIKGGERTNMVPDRCQITNYNVQITNTDNIKVDGSTITTLGIAAHAMVPHKGDNAIWKAFELLSDIPLFATLHSLFATPDAAKNLGIYAKDDSGFQTINIGTIDTDGGKLILGLDLRCPVSQNIDGIIAVLQSSLKNAELTAAVSKTYFAPPLQVDPEGILIRSLLTAYTTVTNLPPDHIRTGGGTYARALPNAVAFGPTFPDTVTNIHNADERISLNQLQSLVDIYSMAIAELDKNL